MTPELIEALQEIDKSLMLIAWMLFVVAVSNALK